MNVIDLHEGDWKEQLHKVGKVRLADAIEASQLGMTHLINEVSKDMTFDQFGDIVSWGPVVDDLFRDSAHMAGALINTVQNFNKMQEMLKSTYNTIMGSDAFEVPETQMDYANALKFLRNNGLLEMFGEAKRANDQDKMNVFNQTLNRTIMGIRTKHQAGSAEDKAIKTDLFNMATKYVNMYESLGI